MGFSEKLHISKVQTKRPKDEGEWAERIFRILLRRHEPNTESNDKRNPGKKDEE